jgi:hypothetical protein
MDKNYAGILEDVCIFIRGWQLLPPEAREKKGEERQKSIAIEVEKFLEKHIFPRRFNQVMLRRIHPLMAEICNKCHEEGLKILVHLCDDEAHWMILPETERYVREYGLDGILVERPPLYFNDALLKINPSLELQALVTSEKYLPPWKTCNQNMEMYQDDIQGPLFRFIVVATRDHGRMTPEKCRELTEKAIISPEIVGFHLYDSVAEDWFYECCEAVDEALKKYKITPSRVKRERLKVTSSLTEILKQEFYQLTIQVGSLEDKIHAPLWFLNPEGELDSREGISFQDRVHHPFWTKAPEGRWEWAGVLITGGVYRKPQQEYFYLFPQKFTQRGKLTLKLDPSWIDGSRPTYNLHGANKWGNFAVEFCQIKRVTIETPHLNGAIPQIEKKVLGEVEYPSGLRIDEAKPTIIEVPLRDK